MARYRVVQALYAWHLGGVVPWRREPMPADKNEAAGDSDYKEILLTNLAANMDSLKQQMDQVLDREAASLDPVEYSIIMLALCELLYSKDVPVAVIIDEAVQLAQTLGGSNSDKYVNAALDTAAARLR